MSINEFLEKIKPIFKRLYLLFLLLIISSIFFGLGRFSTLEKNRATIKIEYRDFQEIKPLNQSASVVETLNLNNSTENTSMEGGEVIGSKSGKKYYYPWCSTVKRIKPENQIHFASIEKARMLGFTAGGNCKGLK